MLWLCTGLTGVKVDCQAGVGVIGGGLGGGGAVALKYHTALEDSIRDNFPGNHCINCMCHSTENLYRCVLCLLVKPGVPGSSHSACWILLKLNNTLA